MRSKQGEKTCVCYATRRAPNASCWGSRAPELRTRRESLLALQAETQDGEGNAECPESGGGALEGELVVEGEVVDESADKGRATHHLRTQTWTSLSRNVIIPTNTLTLYLQRNACSVPRLHIRQILKVLIPLL